MKKLIIILALASFGCSKPDCDEELRILLEKRQQGFKNCNNSFPCLRKIQEEYDSKKQEVIKKCD